MSTLGMKLWTAVLVLGLSACGGGGDSASSTPPPGNPNPNPGVPVDQDLKLNYMRNWTPQVPMLLCGARQDHNVLFDVQTETMAEYWIAEVAKGLVTVLDIDTTPTAADPYAAMKSGFQQWVSQSLSLNGSLTTLTNYHGSRLISVCGPPINTSGNSECRYLD